jgi:hypothetical protein
MRADSIATMEAANQCLQSCCLPKHNGTFSVAPISSFNAHRDQKGFDLDSILCVHADRTVQNDFTISYKGKRCQIEASHCQGKIRKEKIALEERLDGTLKARINNPHFVIHRVE